jgi:hypothetical protein
MADDVRNVFISHIHEDDHRLQPLKDLLQKAGCAVRDASIDSTSPNNATDPAYIKSSILAPGIKWAGALIVLISPGTHESDWVNWEIEYAEQQGKRIIGVWDHGAADCDVPEKLDQFADAVVGWQADRILDALDGKLNNWTTASGDVRAPRSITRHAC